MHESENSPALASSSRYWLLIGAYTRLADAGLECPDWPGCYGFLTVPEQASDISTAEARYPDAPVEIVKAWWEMGHRYIAGALLLLVASILVMAYRVAEEDTSAYRGVDVCHLWQAAFGAWTVTLKLWPQVVTGHLIGGFTTLSLMWLLFLRQGGLSRWCPRCDQIAREDRLCGGCCAIILGGWVSSNYAALACYDFPVAMVRIHRTLVGRGLMFAGRPNYLGGSDERSANGDPLGTSYRCVIVLLVVGALVVQTVKQVAVVGYALLVALLTQITLGVLNVVGVFRCSTQQPTILSVHCCCWCWLRSTSRPTAYRAVLRLSAIAI